MFKPISLLSLSLLTASLDVLCPDQHHWWWKCKSPHCKLPRRLQRHRPRYQTQHLLPSHHQLHHSWTTSLHLRRPADHPDYDQDLDHFHPVLKHLHITLVQLVEVLEHNYQRSAHFDRHGRTVRAVWWHWIYRSYHLHLALPLRQAERLCKYCFDSSSA